MFKIVRNKFVYEFILSFFSKIILFSQVCAVLIYFGSLKYFIIIFVGFSAALFGNPGFNL